jgi:hypothetical protein
MLDILDVLLNFTRDGVWPGGNGRPLVNGNLSTVVPLNIASFLQQKGAVYVN